MVSDDWKWLWEPNRVEFEHAGLKCFIMRDRFLFLGGYVGLSEGHPYYRRHFKDIDAKAHDGLTFSGRGDGERREKDYWWVGFTCDRPADLVPSRPHPLSGDEVYRDIDYVRGEVEKLAEQLRAKV